MSFLEEQSLFVRSGRAGSVTEKGQGIFAAFTHTTSRSQDPQIHDHVILLNTALRPDGKGGAVDARRLFKEIHTLGALYRNELRRNLELQLGLTTVERRVGKERGFEVWGVPEELIRGFSKRRADIEERIKAHEEKTGRKATVKEIQAFTKESRPDKSIESREALFSMWQERGREIGFSPEKLVRDVETKPLSRAEVRGFISEVARKLSYREKISERDVLTVSLKVSRGRLETKELQDFTKSFTSAYLTPTRLKNEEVQYTLNRFGMEKATEKPLYQRIRSSLSLVDRTVKKWLYAVKSRERVRRERAFKVSVTFAYATGRIDRKTYKRLTEKKIPESRVGIEFFYATHQITRRQRDYYLLKVDPKEKAITQRRLERRKIREKGREAKALFVESLKERGLLSQAMKDDVKKGRVSLLQAVRDIERREGIRVEGVPVKGDVRSMGAFETDGNPELERVLKDAEVRARDDNVSSGSEKPPEVLFQSEAFHNTKEMYDEGYYYGYHRLEVERTNTDGSAPYLVVNREYGFYHEVLFRDTPLRDQLEEKGNVSEVRVTTFGRFSSLDEAKEKAVAFATEEREKKERNDALIAEWSGKKLIPHRMIDDYARGMVSYETIERDMIRQGFLEKSRSEGRDNEGREASTKEKEKETERGR